MFGQNGSGEQSSASIYYINPTDNVKELREGIKNYIEYYNTKRPHQGIEHQIPMTKYTKIAA